MFVGNPSDTADYRNFVFARNCFSVDIVFVSSRFVEIYFARKSSFITGKLQRTRTGKVTENILLVKDSDAVVVFCADDVDAFDDLCAVDFIC